MCDTGGVGVLVRFDDVGICVEGGGVGLSARPACRLESAAAVLGGIAECDSSGVAGSSKLSSVSCGNCESILDVVRCAQ